MIKWYGSVRDVAKIIVSVKTFLMLFLWHIIAASAVTFAVWTVIFYNLVRVWLRLGRGGEWGVASIATTTCSCFDFTVNILSSGKYY